MASSEELVDVIDAADNVVAVVTRREMRARRLPHRCVYLLVFNQRSEVFVHLRTATKDIYPGYWDCAVGGVLAAGESFAEGARREGREEMGVVVEPQELFPLPYQDAATDVRGMVYLVKHDGPFQLQAEEIVRGEFIPVEEVARRAAKEPFCPDGLAVLAAFIKTST